MTGDEKRGDLAVGNLNHVEITYKRFKNWVAKQPLPPTVKAAVQFASSTVEAAAQGFWTFVAIGVVADVLVKDIRYFRYIQQPLPRSQPPPQLPPLFGGYKSSVQSLLAGGTMARDIVIARCFYFAGKNLSGGKEDVQTVMVASFSYGVVTSLVSGMRGSSVISMGVIYALFNGGICKALSWGKAEDDLHNKTKGGI